MGLTFVVTLLAVAIFGASFALGYARVNEGRILPGVDVAGVSLAGLDRASAAAKLRESLPDLSSGQLVIDIGTTSSSVRFADLSRDYDMAFMLDQAEGIGRSTNFVEQLQEQLRVLLSGTSISPVAAWDNDALARRVAAIATAAQFDPTNATLSHISGHYVVNPSTNGQSVDVEGAVATAMAAIDNVSVDDAQISVATSVVPPAIDTATAQAAADTAERVMGSDVVVTSGALTTTITSAELRGWVHLDPKAEGGWQLVIERAPIAQAVADYALTSDIAPINASFRFDQGDVAVVAASDGRATDVEATTDNIMATLEARSRGDAATEAGLVLTTVPPTFTTAEATALAPRVTKLGEWTTNYIPNPLNGNGVNIQVPTSIIDGTVVEPGATFDYLDAIGPITSPPYTVGAAIIHGHTVMDGVLGGGMCSASTTLFNAALRSGLDMKARANHAYYIARYPLGLDATVWISSYKSRQTMSFVNDTQYPILIRGINETGKVTYQVFGVDDGRTVEFSDPIIENPTAAVDQVQYTDSLAPGVKKRTEFNVDGMEVWVTRTVKDAAGNIIHQDTFHSKYKTINGITQVGRYPGDPPDGTTIPASQYHPSGPPPPPPAG